MYPAHAVRVCRLLKPPPIIEDPPELEDPPYLEDPLREIAL